MLVIVFQWKITYVSEIISLYFSTAKYVEKEIMRNYCFSVMAVIKAAIHTVIGPRSVLFQMVTGFVLPA